MNTLRRLGGVAFAVLLGLVTFAALYKCREDEKLIQSFQFISPGDKKLFPSYHEYAQFPPRSVVRHFAQRGESSQFDVLYRLDDHALRLEVGRDSSLDYHLVLGGCSYVFGIGLQAWETLSAMLRKIYKEADVVNLGHGAGGLHTQLRLMELLSLDQIVSSRKGLYIFVFINPHLFRWVAHPAHIPYMNPLHPHYELKNNHLVLKLLKDTDPYHHYLSHKDDWFASVQSKHLTDQDLLHFVKGVELLKKRYLTLYPKGKFLFLFHPLGEGSSDERLKNLLSKAGIESLTFFDEFLQRENSFSRDQIFLPDGHPTAQSNEWLAKLIYSKVRL